MRDPDLKKFIDAVERAFAVRIEPDTKLAQLHANIFGAAREQFGEPHRAAPAPKPVTSHLAAAISNAKAGTLETAAVADAIEVLSPRLVWRQRRPRDTDPAAFLAHHANATFLGEGGLELHDDIRIGASLVAPDTLYPDHTHPPEEMYVALSDGEWRNADVGWTRPGMGGVFYNPPGIVHAMRSRDAPLLAVWCLWTGG